MEVRTGSRLKMGSGEEGKLWGGRFLTGSAKIMDQLNFSIAYDRKLWREDLDGSIGYAGALGKVGLLSKEEEKKIVDGLSQVEFLVFSFCRHLAGTDPIVESQIKTEWENGSFPISPSDEDIHTANERRLTELVGDVGRKLHVGRSRNDQVATDMRLWLKSHCQEVKKELLTLIKVSVTRAQDEIDVLMPGYTHLQRAQPIRWSHWLLSHAWAFWDDVARLKEMVDRILVMPLGSGALAGNPFAINRKELAESLGFSHISPNSIQAVGNRDFILEYLWWSSLVGVHLSRWAEDLILFSTQEFGIVKLDDAFSTGSSLMPQKKNPDSLEILRGKAGRFFGNLTSLYISVKGLPMAYNKDLQDDKIAMMDTAENLLKLLPVASGTLQSLKIDSNRAYSLLSPDMLATDLAYYLVRKKVPFREAHGISGKVVAMAEQKGKSITTLTVEELQSVCPKFDQDVKSVWDYGWSVEQYTAYGGTSRVSVEQQIQQLDSLLRKELS
ncbi:unnamed protein product [Darwinula stevensoni]|uniref:Argininosuccinate lyase n=1 Tax=Darwinula stevensoni TaxID=69355 RepID=A0A7R8XFM3_9CRUS|nr:unnamed protein product [Darwinula stevensoni]CAG0895665.1 unnamed protein product [Darwinula stevensoni]